MVEERQRADFINDEVVFNALEAGRKKLFMR